MDMDVAMYFEHEKRFSLKIRGMQLFAQLAEFFKNHKWFKGNHYIPEFNKDTRS